MFRLRKLIKTLRMCYCMAMAQTFGEYQHSVGGYASPDYAVYKWRGKTWAIPTKPMERD